MAENKTKSNDLSAEDFLESIEDPVKKEDSKTIAAMMEELTGNKTLPSISWDIWSTIQTSWKALVNTNTGKVVSILRDLRMLIWKYCES